MQLPPELLGSFYLGAEYDLDAGQVSQTAVNYDARDLTTHAVCFGMTGSGKTGLCISLLEEAALDKVPAILIDPKGDVCNLLLQFAGLQAQDFQAWVNPDDARRAGQSLEDYANAVAQTWRDGLAEWGIGPERIDLLRTSADFTIYTPGSNSGLPISILGSLAAPGLNFDEHAEAIRERISGTVAALLGLIGVAADPIRSREAILLSNIFEHFWRQDQNLDLARLITSIQNPPVRQMGVFDVDTFYPQPERFELAMAFNNLVAAPTFQAWLEGETLDVDRLLYNAQGKPRHSIFYIAHLSDSERMFFVTLLLENVLTWMRRQTGTTSLRALLYLDETFGFFPPIAEPPSKRPLMTLLKQARAVGLGCMLVTQNPGDIDYKGLANAGTWFIGKLQTERDKERVLQGLKSALTQAGQNSERVDYNHLIGQLGQRLFLLHNIHEDQPVFFHTRWAMSYLRGPLTRPQVQRLMANRKQAAAPTRAAALTQASAPSQMALESSASALPAQTPGERSNQTQPGFAPAGFLTTPPAIAPGVTQVYLPISLGQQQAVRQLTADVGRALLIEDVHLVYEPGLVGGGTARFVDRKRDINACIEKVLLAPPPGNLSGASWEAAEALPVALSNLADEPEKADLEREPFFAPAPEGADSPQELKRISRAFEDWLYYNSRLTLAAQPELGLTQRSGETERDFNIRVQQAARERRDAEVDALEQKYAGRIEKLEARLHKQERDLATSEADYYARRHESRVTMGETVVNFFLGRRHTRAVSIIASKQRMAEKAELQIKETELEIAEIEADIKTLENELQEASDKITQKWNDVLDDLTTEEIHPRRTDVDVRMVALAWLPAWLIRYRLRAEGSQGALRTANVAAYALPSEQPASV